MSQVKGDDGSSGIRPPVAGVWGDSQQHCGVAGTSDATGVAGISTHAVGVLGQSGARQRTPRPPLRPGSIGVEGESATGVGVRGWSHTGTGVEGASEDEAGVRGTSKNSTGVYGRSDLPIYQQLVLLPTAPTSTAALASPAKTTSPTAVACLGSPLAMAGLASGVRA